MISRRQHSTDASDAGDNRMAGARDEWFEAFADDGRPWQRSLRWERLPPDRRVLLLGLAIACAITLFELIGLSLGMRWHAPEQERSGAIQVDLIEPAAPLPPIPPEPVPPEFEAREHKVVVAPPQTRIRTPPKPVSVEHETMRARIGTAGTPAVHLFKPDGSIALPHAPAVPTAPRNAQEAGKARWAEIEKRGDNPLDCHRTRFTDAYSPDQSIGDKVAGKYLKWIGLADMQAIEHTAAQRKQRAEEGCEPSH